MDPKERTRLWRLANPDKVRARAARQSAARKAERAKLDSMTVKEYEQYREALAQARMRRAAAKAAQAAAHGDQ